MNDSTFIWPRRDPIIGSFQKRSILPPEESVWGGGGMDVFWNDPFVAGIPQSAKMKNSHTSTLSSLPGRVYSIYI
jgi:hypothetical protein